MQYSHIDSTYGMDLASFALNHVTNVIYRMHFQVMSVPDT